MSSKNRQNTDLEARMEERNKARREAAEQLMGDPMFGAMLAQVLSRRGPDDGFEEKMRQVDRICEEVMAMYENTGATAEECFEILNERLPADVEPDCIGLWQELCQMVEEEEEWDYLSPKEQAKKKVVPKGKKRKPLSAANSNKKKAAVKNGGRKGKQTISKKAMDAIKKGIEKRASKSA